MLQFDLTAEARKKVGKGANRTLRRAGMTPAVVYGGKNEPLGLQLDTKSFTRTLLQIQRRNAVINLNITDGDVQVKRHVMVKEIQSDPVRDTLVHVDFWDVDLDKPMVMEVPVRYTGKAKGVELGGELHVHVAKIPVRGRLLDIPDFIALDVSDLAIGDKLTCGQFQIGAGLEMLVSPDAVCVAVQQPRGQAADAGEEGAKSAA